MPPENVLAHRFPLAACLPLLLLVGVAPAVGGGFKAHAVGVHFVHPVHCVSGQLVGVFISSVGAHFEGFLERVDQGGGDRPASAQGYWVVKGDREPCFLEYGNQSFVLAPFVALFRCLIDV